MLAKLTDLGVDLGNAAWAAYVAFRESRAAHTHMAVVVHVFSSEDEEDLAGFVAEYEAAVAAIEVTDGN